MRETGTRNMASDNLDDNDAVAPIIIMQMTNKNRQKNEPGLPDVSNTPAVSRTEAVHSTLLW